MADFQLMDKLPLTSVDRSADYLLIYDFSASALRRSNVNSLLDLTSHPVGINDAQSLANKILDNTNTVTIKDTLFTLQDDSDTTKQAKFQLSGISTATTRTYTLPDVSDTLVSLAASQTLSGKTLTSPTINTPTINNPTLNTDAISEYTGANGVTIDGLNIKDSKLNTNNSVVTANITDLAVTNAKLAVNTAWTSWVPTISNMSGGTLNYAKYQQIGKLLYFKFKYTLASAGVSGRITFSLPVTIATLTVGEVMQGIATFEDVSASDKKFGIIEYASTTTVRLTASTADTTYTGFSQANGTSSTVPITFASGDIIVAAGMCEVA